MEVEGLGRWSPFVVCEHHFVKMRRPNEEIVRIMLVDST